MSLNILQDLKDTAAQYAYMRVHRDGMRYTDPESNPEKFQGHALALSMRAQYTIELIAEMRAKLSAFVKRAKTQCL
jgi:hypothetical protein